jgi:hypothetical protein
MKRQQKGVLLAGLLALSQLAACSSFGWKGFGSSPMPATAPAASSPGAAAAPASAPAPASVTASAGEKSNASSEPTGQN